MGSRGRFHGPPSRDWGPPQDWGGQYDNRSPPPPQWGPYNDYGPPPDRCQGYPPPQYHNDRGHPYQRPHVNNSRGRGRGQNGAGRGQSYSRGRGMGNNVNGPKGSPNLDEKKNDNTVTGGKPSWLSQPVSTTAASTSNLSKPAWLAQSTSATSSSTDTKPSWLTQTAGSNDSSDNKPSWLTQNSTSSVVSDTKPSWLTQPPVSNSSSSSDVKPTWLTQTTTSSISSDSKPSWLTQTPTSSVSSDIKPSLLTQPPVSNSTCSSDVKPSWLTQTTTSSVSSDSKPAWLNTTISSTATTSSIYSPNAKNLPAWLTKTSGIKPVMKTPKNISNQHVTSNDLLPPPPPPAYPPPPNQPKIQLHVPQQQQQQQQPFTTPPSLMTAIMVSNKPKKKVKDDKEVQGLVALPGQKNFISYKNTLQEFCQKKGVGVPAYKSFKNSFGYSANVQLYTGQAVTSSGIQKDKKEAEQCAAYEALKSLGLISPQTPFVIVNSSKTGAKRQMPSPQTVAKKLKNEIPITSPNYKCQLNEFCQKFHLPVPTYETTNNGNGFITKIIYNKKEYTSSIPQATKRDAELNAAQLVLSKVNQAPPPSAPIKGPVGYPNFIAAINNPIGVSSATLTTDTQTQPNTTTIAIRSMQDLSGKNVTPVISYKNKLQEVCQKQRTNLPVYKNSKDGHLHCCELVVQGQTYNATGCKTKKGAEQSAARVALEALGLLDK